MNHETTSMDGFTGAIMAVESFSDIKAALHGPGGCRNYHSFISRNSYPRSDPDNREKYWKPFFFGQYRIPCTYIDEDDYIYGAETKLRQAIPEICGIDEGYTVFIGSPGASLIGDNITDMIADLGYSNKAMAVEESMISLPYAFSYDHTIRSILDRMPEKKKRVGKGCVNLLGLPITSKDWQHSLSDLTHILDLMGLKVIATPGAGASMKDMDSSLKAEYNIVISKEYCARTAELYESRYGIPSLVCDEGAPVGFDATSGWIKMISEKTGKDPTKALEYVKDKRLFAYRKIKDSINRNIECRTFSVMAEPSVLCPLTKWLHSYLGMIPSSLVPVHGENMDTMRSLKEYLKRYGLEDALSRPFGHSKTDVVLADGNTSGIMEKMGKCKVGVNLSAPDMNGMSFLPRPVMGVTGSLYILDEIFNKI